MPLYLYSKTVPCIYFAVPSKTDFQNTVLIVSSSTSVYSRTQTKFDTKRTYIQKTKKNQSVIHVHSHTGKIIWAYNRINIYVRIL